MAAAAVCTARDTEALLAEVVVRTGSSDREATAQALLERLAVAPDDAVLEIGVGNGRLLAAVAARVPRGSMAGVDVSERMLRHAGLRCGRFVAEGRVSLALATSADLSALEDARFDRVYGVHVPYFWSEPARDVGELHRVLRPGGRLVLGYWPGDAAGPPARASRDRAHTSVARLERLLAERGFSAIATDRVRDGGRCVAWTTAQR